MNGSGGSKLTGGLRGNYGFLIVGGRGQAYRGALLPSQFQDGASPVMKPKMWMWLATPAGNNGLSH